MQKRGMKTRSKIIDAGQELFGEKGFHKTNAVEIAARAGVGTGTFYSYFNNKKEVMVEGLRRFYAQALGMMADATLTITFSRENGRQCVRLMIETLIAAHDADPALHRQVMAMMLLDKEIEDLCADEDMTAIRLISAYLEEHKDVFRITDYEAAATVIMRVCDEIVHRIRLFTPKIEEKRLISELEDMMCRYLLKDPG